MKLSSSFLIAILLLQVFTEALATDHSHKFPAQIGGAGKEDEAALTKKVYHHAKINCGYACGRRCRKASRKNVCSRACTTCCRRCNCVPPGTYGNTHLCPCYAKLKTHGGHPKCP
nr:gibberellin-regulated protein 9 [Ipomoea batatas]GMD53048.1 gibberellin-regulated protein 9 [Ipomoea batatas]